MRIARWTFGPVSTTGIDILMESVKLFQRLYPEFDRVVCYNHVERSKLCRLNAELHEQAEEDSDICLRPPDNNSEEASGCGWKLCPPRLLPDGHELWLDNDLIVCCRLPHIDEWLRGNGGIISEGLHRKRMYGEFDQFVTPGVHVCAGLFGLPPGFDFNERIKYYSKFATKSIGGYDEQGLTAAIVTNMPNWILVPLSQLHISEDYALFPDILPPAIHFVGANRKPWHRGWKAYQRRKII